MSTTHVVLAKVTEKGRADTGATLPLPNSVPIGSDTINSSASASQSTLVGQVGQFWLVVATVAVWVKFGGNPTAAADDGWYVPAGVPMSFAVSAADEKISVRDV